MAQAGRFEMTASDPYPVWINLRVDGETVARLDHKEISDPLYVIKKAENEARNKLPQGERGEML